MKVVNLAKLAAKRFAEIKNEVSKHKTLAQVLAWANAQPKENFLPQIVAEVVTQDEFTHDVIVPYKDLFLVYDTTRLGAVTAVAVWKHQPDANELLISRLQNGWKPTPSSLKEGDKILGNAAGCIIEEK
jgi:hypothetical protein